MLTNIFVFVFGPEVDPEYIRIHIRVKKNINSYSYSVPKKIFATLWWLAGEMGVKANLSQK